MMSIDPNLDLGQGRTIGVFRNSLDRVKSQIASYNALIAKLEGERNQVESSELAMGHMNRDYLAAVGLRYGYDSTQYEQVGGKLRTKFRRNNNTKPDTGSATPPVRTAEPGPSHPPAA